MPNFITSNPATDSYQKGMQFAQQQRLGEQQVEAGMLSNVENRVSAPLRLRQQTAATDTAETNARVASATAGSRVRSARASATNAEMQGFYKSLEYLRNGDIEGAKAIAAATGQTIPEEVLQNRQLAAAVDQAAQYAQQTYPNRPQAQQTYITSFLTELAQRQQAGKPINDPTMVYQIPNAPTPPETTSTALSNGGGVYEFKYNAWLSAYPGDVSGALTYAQGTKQMTPADIYKMANDIVAKDPNATYLDPAERNQQIDGLYQKLNAMNDPRYNTAPVTPAVPTPSVAAPVAAPSAPVITEQPQIAGPAVAPAMPQAAPAPTGSQPPGTGSRIDPYVATTQDQIEWFKATAPAGAMISINGELYTK